MKVESVDGELITRWSLSDIYANRHDFTSDVKVINSNFINFHSHYFLKDGQIKKRRKMVIVRTIPTYSSYRKGVNYGSYCKFNLIKYKPWSRTIASLWNNNEECDETFIGTWGAFLQSEIATDLVPHFAFELENLQSSTIYEKESDASDDENNTNLSNQDEKEEWMFLSELLINNPNDSDENDRLEDVQYWNQQRSQFTEQEISNMPAWISAQRSIHLNDDVLSVPSDESENIEKLNLQQRKAFDLVIHHSESDTCEQLLLLVIGKAGSGKSFLIDRLRYALNASCYISALFGIAAYNVSGKTLHYLLKLPVRGKRNHDLQGASLSQIQNTFCNKKYLIIDEYSVISQRDLSWVNRRCKQATGITEKAFGGINIILVGDLGQLPPVNGKVLYHHKPSTEHDSEGFFLYNMFQTVIELTINQRVSGNNQDCVEFKNLLSNIRDGKPTLHDWNTLLTRTPRICNNIDSFSEALRLSYGNREVAENNFTSLKSLQKPIAEIKAIHSKASAAKFSADDMGGLSPCIYLAVGARVMLTRNLWTEVGLCNGSLGTIHNIVYASAYELFPVAILVQFDTYSGPCFNNDNVVPIAPCSSTSESYGSNFERTQFPLKLAWAITIHKSQGLTLPKVWIDLGSSEKSPGLTYVALSRVRKLQDLIVEPMSYERLTSISNSANFQYRISEEHRLHDIAI